MPLVVTCGVISAVVVVVVAVADSAVFWHFRWPGGLWRPLLGLSEHAEPRWCYEVRVAAVGNGIGAVRGHLRRDLGRGGSGGSSGGFGGFLALRVAWWAVTASPRPTSEHAEPRWCY